MVIAPWTRARIFAAMTLAVVLVGCASHQYRFGTETYDTRAEAVGAVQQFVDSSLEQIVPVRGPVGGQAVVILASKSRMLSKGVATAGEPTTAGDETADFLAEATFMGHAMMGEAIERAQLFDHLNVTSSDDPASTARITGGQYVIWYDLRDWETAQWYVRSRSDGSVRRVPVDTAEEIGAPRIQKWLQSLNDALARGGAEATPSKRPKT